MLKCWTLLVFLASLLCKASLSYGQSITPLHSFFQHNYDSTFIYQRTSSWNNAPDYLILAKHGQQLDFFTYTSPYHTALGHYYPGRLTQRFMHADALFRATVPDTNRYLLPKPIASAILEQHWRQLQVQSLWRVSRNQQSLALNNPEIVEDGEESSIYFLDKQAIRLVRCYALTAGEAKAEKDPERLLVLKVITTFRALLQNGQ